jgi:glyoxylase-like metal-dependent hydrolase (beta-lactamase superfamily II)
MAKSELKMESKAENALVKAERIDIGDEWFEVRKLPKDTIAIIENGHMQEVCSFLIVGTEKALLFDTGMGISDISKVVRQLSDLEILIVNSHTHFDHIGDNWRFPTVHVFADDETVKVLTEGFSHWDVRYDSDPELFSKAVPPGFDLERYFIRPVQEENIRLLHDGDIIDLGNRQLEVMHTPGHSKDSIMLFDRKNRSLFTGDTYCEWLFAFIDSRMPKFGRSNLEDYAQTMQDLGKLVPELDYLYPSHGKPLADPEILTSVAKAFDRVIQGEADYFLESVYGYDRRVYEFDGFSIWTS